jgi:hypothetical protein
VSALLDTARALADGPIPNFEPTLPKELKGPTQTLLGWTAGAGLFLAVMAGLIGWGLSAFGEYSERGGLAARGKKAIITSMAAGLGVSLTSSLVLVFYNLGA